MKKTLLTILAALALLALAIGFTACGEGGNRNNASSDNKFDDLTTTEEVYGFSAATAGTLISSMNGVSAQALAQAKGLTVLAQSGVVTDEETIAALNEYMMLVESLLSDGAFGMTEGESDLPDYEKKAEVTYKDILGNTLSYTMYYNETLRPDHDDDDDHDGHGAHGEGEVLEYDEHVWTSPVNAAAITRAVGERRAQADPATRQPIGPTRRRRWKSWRSWIGRSGRFSTRWSKRPWCSATASPCGTSRTNTGWSATRPSRGAAPRRSRPPPPWRF